MRTFTNLACCLLLSAMLAGCGGESDVKRQQLDLATEVVVVMEGVKDEASYKAMNAKMKPLNQKAKDLENKFKALPEEKQKELIKKYEKEDMELGQRMRKARENMGKFAPKGGGATGEN